MQDHEEGPDAQQEEELALWLASIARELAAASDVRSTLQRLVDLVVETVVAVDDAGVSLVVGSSIETPAQTGQVPRRLDELQERLGEGPCIDTVLEDEVFETGDLVAEDRWPRFSTEAVDATEVRSVLSMRLFVTDAGTMGALNLYSTTIDAFDDHDRALAAAFAAHGAVAVRAARTAEQMQEALGSRDVIGQAKGILMTRGHIGADAAFELLARASQDQNKKLRDVATFVVEHRDEL